MKSAFRVLLVLVNEDQNGQEMLQKKEENFEWQFKSESFWKQKTEETSQTYQPKKPVNVVWNKKVLLRGRKQIIPESNLNYQNKKVSYD